MALHRELQGIWEEACRWVAEERQRAPPQEWEERARGWEEEVAELARRGWRDPNCRRIAKRLGKHAGELFTFVACPGVDGTNNAKESAAAIRGAAKDLRRPSVLGGGEEAPGADERTCHLWPQGGRTSWPR